MIQKLRNRLTGTIMAFVSVIMLSAFLAVFTISFLRIQTENNERIMREEFVDLETDGQIILNGQQISNPIVVNRISPALGVYFNLVSNQEGELIYIDSALTLDSAIYTHAAKIASENPDGGTVNFEGRLWQYASAPATINLSESDLPSEREFMSTRFLDITDSYKTLETLLYTLVVLYFVLMIVFFVLARHFANRSIRPMAEAWGNQRQFIADASHELKTPISTLNANLDVLYASQEDTIKNQAKWLDSSKRVLGRMTTLIKNMMELAKVDELNEKADRENVDVSEMLEGVLDYFEPAANEKRIKITENIDENIPFFTNHGLLQQVLEILMDNAIKYTDNHGQITIDAHAERSGIVIRITNTGAGIASNDIERIFDRFYRGDKARVHNDDSYGLGLSIAKSAIAKLGGSISAESEPGHTRFTVKIANAKNLM